MMCLAGVAAMASAQPLEFVIDPAQSSFDMTITIDLGGLGGDTDSDSSSLSGFMLASFDDPGAPSDTSLHDFQAVMDSDLNFNWVPAFLSTADASLTGGVVEYAAPGTVLGPVPVVGGGFEFPVVPVTVGGVLSVNYNIFLVGSGSEVVDLSTLAPSDTPIAGDIVQGDGVVTMSNTILFEGTQPLFLDDGTEVGQVIFSGAATVVATADLPSCPADMNSDGVLNFLDVSAFLAAFAAQDPAADFELDGMYNFLDVSAFLSSYGAGCP